MFYGRYGDHIKQYEVPRSRMIKSYFKTDFQKKYYTIFYYIIL